MSPVEKETLASSLQNSSVGPSDHHHVPHQAFVLCLFYTGLSTGTPLVLNITFHLRFTSKGQRLDREEFLWGCILSAEKFCCCSARNLYLRLVKNMSVSAGLQERDEGLAVILKNWHCCVSERITLW